MNAGHSLDFLAEDSSSVFGGLSQTCNYVGSQVAESSFCSGEGGSAEAMGGAYPPKTTMGNYQELTRMQVVAMNLACSLGTDDNLAAFIGNCDIKTPGWSVLCLQEVDAKDVRFKYSAVSHKVLRHHPGEGSRAMMMVVHRRLKQNIMLTKWVGRAGLLVLQSTGVPADSVHRIAICNVHGAHDAEFIESLTDIRNVSKHIPYQSAKLLCGDWNCDQLPVCADDPFAAELGRKSRHRYERNYLKALLDRMGVSVCLPRLWAPCQPPFVRSYSDCVVTRMPSDPLQRPSVLDYAAANMYVTPALAEWTLWQSDHAAIRYTFSVPMQTKKRRSTFQPTSEADLIAWVCNNGPTAVTMQQLEDYAIRGQDRNQSPHNAFARSRGRLSTQARGYYAAAAQATRENQRRDLLREAARVRTNDATRARQSRERDAVSKGKVLEKSKKLFEVDGVCIDGVKHEDHETIRESVLNVFQNKWGCGKLQAWENAMLFASRHEGRHELFTPENLSRAFALTKRRRKLDGNGVSLEFLRMLHVVLPGFLAHFLNLATGSIAAMRQMTSTGRVVGKASAFPCPDETRAIMPLTALQTVVDIVVANLLIGYLNGIFPVVPSTLVAGGPGTQTMDIAFSCSLVLEKGNDMRGRSAICQADIKGFYDNLPLLKLCVHMVQAGVPAALMAVCLRIQLFTKVVLNVGHTTIAIARRTKGGLTGTRTAGALGRIPILDMIAARKEAWRADGFRLGSGIHADSLTMATYIDNLYAVSSEVEGAMKIMTDAERYLLKRWQLTLKLSSKMITSAAVGSEHVEGDTVNGYVYHQDFPVLGHLVNNTGSIAYAFENTPRKMWKAFWGNAGSRRARTLGQRRKVLLIARAVRPLFEFVCARWPAQITYLDQIDVIQRKMVSLAFGLRRTPAESMKKYNARCGRAAAPFIDLSWSQVWCTRMQSWQSHMERHAELWPARISAYQDARWLQTRRLLSGSPSLFAGLTGTRARAGKVQRRWQEGLAFSQDFLAKRT